MKFIPETNTCVERTKLDTYVVIINSPHSL